MSKGKRRKGRHKIVIHLKNEDKGFLDEVIGGFCDETAESYTGAVEWLIDSCRKIESTYGVDACYVGYNDIRKPENDPDK